MRTIHILGILVLLALAVPAAPAHAGGVVTVCDEAHLLAALAGGGTVTFSCSGTITLTNTITISADTTIDGSGQTVTISGNDAVRVFTVNSGVTFNLDELTVANGFAAGDAGGGILNAGTLTVSNSILLDNNAHYGGGILNDSGGWLTVNHSSFSGNGTPSSGGSGGAITNYNRLSVNHSTFSGNASLEGGAIANMRGGVVIVSDSTFSENVAHWGGGGIYDAGYFFDGVVTVTNSTFSANHADTGGGILTYGNLTVTNSTFIGNRASGGGGVWNNGGTATVDDSTFSGNRADLYQGGGISSDGTLTVSNSTFFGNSATASGGGGIWNNGEFGTATVTNSTFSVNNASSGGGIYTLGNNMIVTNSTFSGNRANEGGGVYQYSFGAATLKNTIVANSSMGDNCSGPFVNGGGNLSYPDTTCPGINADPKLGPLQHNGGPTETMALGEGSAAIDAADDAICAAPPVNNLDQRGFPRPWGAHCDIGAVEQIQEPSAVSVSALRAQSLPGTISPAMIAGLLLLVLVAVGVQRRPRHIG
jgi:predicted outer membrane repeat protein